MSTDKISSVKNKIYINDGELQNVVIVNDNQSNTVVVPQQMFVASDDNVFLSMLKQKYEEMAEKQKSFSEMYLKQKREDLTGKISEGLLCYQIANFEKALNLFEESLRTIQNDEYPDEFLLKPDDIFSIKYCIALCNIQRMEHGSLDTAIAQLKHLIEFEDLGSKWPVLYLSQAEAHYALRQYTASIDVLKIGLNIVCNCNSPVCPDWPGTETIINGIDANELKNKMNELLKECTVTVIPDAHCYYSLCLTLGNAQTAIYFE